MPAAITGCVLVVLLFVLAGYAGMLMMTTFFLSGSLATSYGLAYKTSRGLVAQGDGRRNSWQVLANAGLAGIWALANLVGLLHTHLAALLIACVFSSATADTLSSEVGNVLGKHFYNITTFKTDTRGLNGVISIEGTLAGLAGSILISVVYSLFYGFGTNTAIVIIAGTIGNLADSLLGATFERKRYLGNNAVNFINTIIASLAGYLLWWMW